MNTTKIKIVLLYNDDSQAGSVHPQDLEAIQSTISTTGFLHEALVALGYATHKLAVHDSLETMASDLKNFSTADTLVFNNCDGFNGSNQDAVLIVRLLEELGFKHTGASAAAMDFCIHKARTKERLLAHHVPTPRCQVFEHPGQEFTLTFPAIVKPVVEDGSIGITLKSVVTNHEQLQRQVAEVLDTYAEPALVEEFIVGRELAVAMLGNQRVEVLPIAEDDYSQIANPLERLLTYESKWDTECAYYGIPSRIPADLNPEDEKVIKDAARDSFHAIGLRDFGRVDIRFKDGIPYVIDINELPDLAPDAGFWHSAQAAGMSYPQMVEKILHFALHREGWIS